MLTPETKQLIFAMRQSGQKQTLIALTLGVSFSTVNRLLIANGMRKNKTMAGKSARDREIVRLHRLDRKVWNHENLAKKFRVCPATIIRALGPYRVLRKSQQDHEEKEILISEAKLFTPLPDLPGEKRLPCSLPTSRKYCCESHCYLHAGCPAFERDLARRKELSQ